MGIESIPVQEAMPYSWQPKVASKFFSTVIGVDLAEGRQWVHSEKPTRATLHDNMQESIDTTFC